jgi:hypothetical protein
MARVPTIHRRQGVRGDPGRAGQFACGHARQLKRSWPAIFEFYRQSMLLVGWLRAQDEARFRQLALAVQNNADFEIAFWDIYGQAPATRLAGFFEGVLSDNQPIQAAPANP